MASDSFSSVRQLITRNARATERALSPSLKCGVSVRHCRIHVRDVSSGKSDAIEERQAGQRTINLGFLLYPDFGVPFRTQLVRACH